MDKTKKDIQMHSIYF